MITVDHLTREFAGVAALRDVSFSARPGEVVGLLGENGAGKTTTLRVLTGYLAATSGRVTVDGHDVAREPRAARRAIGYLPEAVALYGEMRVAEYLAYRAALKGVPARSRRSRVEEAAAEVGLTDALGRIVGQLSRGYRQRVGLADALTHHPHVLVLDEPTEGLDPNQRTELLEVVRRLGRERTVLLSTHVLAEAEAVCQRVVILARGAVVATGTPAELGVGGEGVEVTIEARGDAKAIAAALESVEGVREVAVTVGEEGLARYRVVAARDVREQAARAIVDAKGALRELRLVGGALDRVFARLGERGK